MTRRELIEFALWLYEGKEKEFIEEIEEKVDEWLRIRAKWTPNGEKVLKALDKLRASFDDTFDVHKLQIPRP